MKIKLNSVMVDDQDQTLKFYTEVLGFVKKTDIPVRDFKWLTVVSPDGPHDIELVLEPNALPALLEAPILSDFDLATRFRVSPIIMQVLFFLVRPSDGKRALEIFRVNTCLWGGKYNPIFPV